MLAGPAQVEDVHSLGGRPEVSEKYEAVLESKIR